MRAVLLTVDLVWLSAAQAALTAAGIDSVVFDEAISVTEGSIGLFPRRLMVADDDAAEALEIVKALEGGV
jgi:hypothetical protein